MWLNLRSYPPVLLFTAYGIGLTRAQRCTLHELFSAIIAREYREPRRTVEMLFLWDWKGSDNNLWKQIDGLENRKTALSDHLCDLFSDWGKSFAGLTPDFEMMFERFEVLASMAHLESTAEADLEQALTRMDSPVRMPVGRVGWHGSNRNRLIQELQSEAIKNALFAAGFAKGSEKFMELFLGNLVRIAARMEW